MVAMAALDALRDTFPDAAKDARLNLQAVLSQTSLSADQAWGVAVACAAAVRCPKLYAAVLADAQAHTTHATIEDAKAAAVVMAMNNVYYRFRHLIENPAYGDKPARLRMNRLAQPQASKVDFELMSLAVSAINGCATCMQAHERVVLQSGVSEDQVHDAVRIAAVISSAAMALEVGAAT